MLLTGVAIGVFLAVFLGLTALILRLSRSPQRLKQRLADARAGERLAAGDGRGGVARMRDFNERLFVLDPASFTSLRARLVHAGYRGRHSPFWYRTTRFVLMAAAVTAAVQLPHFIELGKTLTVLIVVGAGIMGYALPAMWVNDRVARRRDAIRAAIPNVLDLIIVCVEAGLSLNAAVQRIAAEMRTTYPELATELSILNEEIFIGKSRGEAFRNLARRTGVDELRSLATVLTQSDRMGTSVADVLRVQAQTLRTKRRQMAMEAAHKMPVKLVFPLVLCIFPEMLVVLLGPGAIQFFRTLSEVAK